MVLPGDGLDHGSQTLVRLKSSRSGGPRRLARLLTGSPVILMLPDKQR